MVLTHTTPSHLLLKKHKRSSRQKTTLIIGYKILLAAFNPPKLIKINENTKVVDNEKC